MMTTSASSSSSGSSSSISGRQTQRHEDAEDAVNDPSSSYASEVDEAEDNNVAAGNTDEVEGDNTKCTDVEDGSSDVEGIEAAAKPVTKQAVAKPAATKPTATKPVVEPAATKKRAAAVDLSEVATDDSDESDADGDNSSAAHASAKASTARRKYNVKEKTGKTRTKVVWPKEQYIQALAILSSIKCAKGTERFKPADLQYVAKLLNRKFPGCAFTEEHIRNKLKTIRVKWNLYRSLDQKSALRANAPDGTLPLTKQQLIDMGKGELHNKDIDPSEMFLIETLFGDSTARGDMTMSTVKGKGTAFAKNAMDSSDDDMDDAGTYNATPTRSRAKKQRRDLDVSFSTGRFLDSPVGTSSTRSSSSGEESRSSSSDWMPNHEAMVKMADAIRVLVSYRHERLLMKQSMQERRPAHTSRMKTAFEIAHRLGATDRQLMRLGKVFMDKGRLVGFLSLPKESSQRIWINKYAPADSP
ncbi:hypothetical protein BC831DRAFT_448281 [Entophlyctis helioformis]|nr:hypothetical protein BC831DRAFT_448281 [Entophlyctis helioformis]